MTEKPEKNPALFRHRTFAQKEVQTEASFVPGTADLTSTYDKLASEQYNNLVLLRKEIQRVMQGVTGAVYDTVHFKDILFKYEESFPTSLPVSDILLISSKLFRFTCELGRLLSCFFAAVFSDCNVDEHFHFTEIRTLQKELKSMQLKLEESEAEQIRLQKVLSKVSEVALDHGKAVEALDHHNQALQLQTSALEDQMALLFHQLNTDLKAHCKDAFDKVASEMEFQERLGPTRNTFRQTMDSLAQQIRTSRGLISEVRESLVSCNQGAKTGEAFLAVEPSIRFKLKMLDSNFQQLIGRFNSVKDTVAETAHELMNALHERKKILYLSFQHIRLYDIQSSKLRHGKAILTELRSYTSDLLKKMLVTFPNGAITSIDRIGRITTHRWKGGYTLDALRRNKHGLTDGEGETKGLSEVDQMAAESELKAYSSPYQTQDTSPSAVSPAERSFDGQAFHGDGGSSDPSHSPQSVEAGEGGGKSGSRKKFVLPKGGILPPAEIFVDVPSNAVPFDSIHLLMDLIKAIDTDLERLTDSLTLDDEMSAFLRTLTLSIPSTIRLDGADGKLDTGFQDGGFEMTIDNALQSPGLQNVFPQNTAYSLLNTAEKKTSGSGEPLLFSPDAPGAAAKQSASDSHSMMSKTEQSRTEVLLVRQAHQLQKQQEQIVKLNEDYSTKLGFLRQIYEARITDLEIKEASYRNKIGALGEIGTTGKKRNTLQNLQDSEIALVRDMNAKRGKDTELEQLNTKSDEEELLALRGSWKKAKSGILSTQSMRENAAKEIQKINPKILEKRDRMRIEKEEKREN